MRRPGPWFGRCPLARISPGGHLHRPELQRLLLEQEGIVSGERGVVELRRFGWRPPASLLLPM
jgi:hypothetical protein